MINSNRTYYFTIKIQLELLEDRVVDALKNISLDVNSIIRLNGKDDEVEQEFVGSHPGDDINTSVDTQANIATAVYEASS
ncbi:unnamed protein product [Adineta steineri]|uniref:Uncharacterized protein n=1 Tax=Adineta steineri TaxID=433720 RepID=A0A814XA44_9BILA|nr:unnamed protein product [Adineta steineri]